MKRCARCEADKSPDDFNKDRYKRDGLRSYCRECDRAISGERYDKARDLIRARNSARYWKREAMKARNRIEEH